VKHQVSQEQSSQPISNSSAMERLQCFDHNSHGLSVERDELNLDLNLGSLFGVSKGLVDLFSSVPVSCLRCHSSSYSRFACKAPIKCDKCLGWGHVAASCRANWENLQRRVNGRPLDNFTKDFGPSSDHTIWFNLARMTTGPSAPPWFLDFSDFSGAPWPSHTIHWDPPCSSRLLVDCIAHPRNPSPLHSHSPNHHKEGSPMAYFCADPAPFIPKGLH